MARLMDKFLDAARSQLNAMQDRIVDFETSGGMDGWAGRVADRIRVQEERLASGKHALNPDYQSRVRLWYARLELPYGADRDEVRRAFRSLMRKYHPDRYTGDADTERLATRLSQELTVAYEGLLEYLGP